MNLREQIEALPKHEFIDSYEPGTLWEAVDLAAVIDIIDAHRCIPDRDALARALRNHPMRNNQTFDDWADAIIAALEAQP